ncbi:MAG: hypothetical protein HY700_13605 [Gemmatimonadetes bacterium]|nr:hypothetical protein [Gemmatimonadota bacterium]
MSRNLVGGPQPVSGDLALNVEKAGEGDSARYELFVHWTSNFRVDIKAGQSLIVSADGREFVFTAAKKDVRRDSSCDVGPCMYDERAYYPATADQIRAIASASDVLVEITGSKRTIQRQYTETNTENFRDFVRKYLPQGTG